MTTNRALLEAQLTWLRDRVLPGFIETKVKWDAVERTRQHIADLTWRLAEALLRRSWGRMPSSLESLSESLSNLAREMSSRFAN